MADDIDIGYPNPVETPMNRDLDMAYWHFWSDLIKAPMPELTGRQPPQDPIGEPLPPGTNSPGRVVLPVRNTQWTAPNFWAVPFEVTGERCNLFYKTWFSIINEQVLDTKLVLIDQISYQFENLPLNEVFEISVLRSGIELARWEDMMINPGGTDPATWHVFGGHFIPVPFFGRFDQSEQITVRIKALGPEAADGTFPRIETDPLNATIRVVIRGWQATMLDRRNGAPRPVDPGVQLDNYGKVIIDPAYMDAAYRLMQQFVDTHNGGG